VEENGFQVWRQKRPPENSRVWGKLKPGAGVCLSPLNCALKKPGSETSPPDQTKKKSRGGCVGLPEKYRRGRELK